MTERIWDPTPVFIGFIHLSLPGQLHPMKKTGILLLVCGVLFGGRGKWVGGAGRSSPKISRRVPRRILKWPNDSLLGGRRGIQTSWRSRRRSAGNTDFLAFSSAVGGGKWPNDSLLGGWRGIQTSWRSRRRNLFWIKILGLLSPFLIHPPVSLRSAPSKKGKSLRRGRKKVGGANEMKIPDSGEPPLESGPSV